MSLFNPLYILSSPRAQSPRRVAPSVNTHRPTSTPLAGSLLQQQHAGLVDPQPQSPLLALPPEIRALIWAFTLTRYENRARPYNRARRYVRPGCAHAPRIATELLETCKAVYLEAFLLPVRLNALVAHHGDTDDVPAQFPMWFRPVQAPWQFCSAGALELHLQQAKLEDDWIGRYALWLMAGARHAGLRITESPVKDIVGSVSSGRFLHLKTFAAVADDAVRVKEAALAAAELPHPPWEAKSMASRLNLPPDLVGLWRPWYIPRRITHLTLALGRTDWWSWAEPPTSDERLGLDPACGDFWAWNRPSHKAMQAAAAARRAGEAPAYTPKSWGGQVCMFPSLKTLELDLETFHAKAEQLDAVVECARTWTFGMADGFELAFARSSRSKWKGVGEYGYERRSGWLMGMAEEERCRFEVRKVRFEARRVYK